MRIPKFVAKLERSAGSLETWALRLVPAVKSVLWTCALQSVESGANSWYCQNRTEWLDILLTSENSESCNKVQEKDKLFRIQKSLP